MKSCWFCFSAWKVSDKIISVLLPPVTLSSMLVTLCYRQLLSHSFVVPCFHFKQTLVTLIDLVLFDSHFQFFSCFVSQLAWTSAFSLCQNIEKQKYSIILKGLSKNAGFHCDTDVLVYCKRGGIHNISRPVSLAISHRRNMFPLVLRPAGQPIPSTVHNPKRVDLVVGCSILYCAARPVIRARPTVSHPSINNRSQQQFQDKEWIRKWI